MHYNKQQIKVRTKFFYNNKRKSLKNASFRQLIKPYFTM